MIRDKKFKGITYHSLVAGKASQTQFLTAFAVSRPPSLLAFDWGVGNRSYENLYGDGRGVGGAGVLGGYW